MDLVRGPLRRPVNRSDTGRGVETDVQVPVRVEREDGLLVAEGTTSVGSAGEPSYLSSIDLRQSDDPADMRMSAALEPGSPIPEHEGRVDSDAPLRVGLLERMTEPLDWYTGPSPWGGAIANPSAVVGLLWQRATRAFGTYSDGAVGLFRAIEIRHHRRPVFVDRPYRVAAEVVAVGHSPKSGYVWFDTRASDEDGLVASMRMQLRWMKASSRTYADAVPSS